jgi:hypothetical protein
MEKAVAVIELRRLPLENNVTRSTEGHNSRLSDAYATSESAGCFLNPGLPENPEIPCVSPLLIPIKDSRLASPASAWGAVRGRKSPLPSFECVR